MTFALGTDSGYFAVQRSMVVGDEIAGYIWATGRGEEETSFTPFAFSRSRFLCAGTMVLGRGHRKALRRAWDTYFWLLPLVFGISSYVYMTTRDRESFLFVRVLL